MIILSQSVANAQLEAIVREVLRTPSRAMEASIIQARANRQSLIAFSALQASIAMEMEAQRQLPLVMMVTTVRLHRRFQTSTRRHQATILSRQLMFSILSL